MKKKLIIFDMDGVLFDSTKHVNEFFLRLFPGLSQETMDEILSGNFHEELAKFKLTHKPIEETPEEKEKRVAEYSAKKMQLPLFPGIKELLTSLHASGCILTINTSAIERNCLPLLEYAGISKLFDFVATKEVSASKVEKFKILKEKYGVKNDETIFITDTLGDIREAKTAGIPTIAVTYGAHNRSFFTREPHDTLVAIVDSIDELKSHLLS